MFSLFRVVSGTTAVVALYRDGMIWVANAGDSRAVLGTLEETAATAVSDGEPVEEKLVSVSLECFYLFRGISGREIVLSKGGVCYRRNGVRKKIAFSGFYTG